MTSQVNLPSTFPEGQPAFSDDFQQRVTPYARELLVHCYRFFGSMEDAEDALQETLLRAWRRMDTLKEPAALRGWLYRIATNVSLDLLERMKSRSLPSLVSLPSDPTEPLADAPLEPLWLQPLPDEYLAGSEWSPEARYERTESVSFAFLAVLQKLPGRQRAVLILRDVLGMNAQETAEILRVTTAAVNSALQRARLSLSEYRDQHNIAKTRIDANHPTSDLLARYLRAWESEDPGSLISLLKDDAILTMPPLPAWFQGCDAIISFYRSEAFHQWVHGPLRLLATRANGCPAFAIYQSTPDGNFIPSALHVLTLSGNQIARIDTFLGLSVKQFQRFDLPAFLSPMS